MGWIGDLFRPKGQVVPDNVHQASPAYTPMPRVDDYGGDGHYSVGQSVYIQDGPSPAHIEWLWNLSDEWARTVQRLRIEVWRQGIKVEPLHPKFCSACGEGIDEDEKPCPGCDTEGTAISPDSKERSQLQDFMELANRTSYQNLVTVGQQKTEEGLKHGRSFLIFKTDWMVREDGTIESGKVKGVTAGSSARITNLKRGDGTPGGMFVCIRCRTEKDYTPSKDPGKCGCGYVLYEAWYAQHENQDGGKLERFWLREEVHETRWPYTDGSSPIQRLWPKASSLLMMDWYASWALDPKRDKRPDKILVTAGGDENSIKAWAKRDSEERKKNPYKLSHLHIPSPPGGMGDFKALAEVLDLGEKEFKGQMLELRKGFEDAMRKHYGLSSLTAGDDMTGGLGQSQGPKMRTTAQVAEDVQRAETEWLRRLAQKLGCQQWTYAFVSALEEDSGAEAEETTKWLDVATKAADAGLIVEWRAGRPHIQDGKIEKKAQPDPFGGMGLSGQQPGAQEAPPEGGEDAGMPQGEVDGVPVTSFRLDRSKGGKGLPPPRSEGT